MSSIPYTLEPVICRAHDNSTVMSEIYLRITCAAVYHNFGRDDQPSDISARHSLTATADIKGVDRECIFMV